MTTIEPDVTTRLPDALPHGAVEGPAVEDPTIALPVVPVQHVPSPTPPAGYVVPVVPVPSARPAAYAPPVPLAPPIGDPYGPPAGLGHHLGYPPLTLPRGSGTRRSRAGRVVGGVLAAAGVVTVVAMAATPSEVQVRGTFTLTDSGSGYWGSSLGSFTPGRSCGGDGGYSDIQAGTAVTISDASGRIVATGALTGGTATSRSDCAFTFAVPDVPTGEGFYRLEVSHRGSLTYTEEQLRSGPSVSLGD